MPRTALFILTLSACCLPSGFSLARSAPRAARRPPSSIKTRQATSPAPVRGAAAPAETISYNRQIRPILAENCFACHGPDSASRMAGLRLDLRDAAIRRGVIVPGRPEKSPLVARTSTADVKRVMPPVSSHKKLTAQQRALLRRWVAAGAPYQPHWALIPPPAQVPIPRVTDARWPVNAIDRFVLSRLEKQNLKPSPPADPAVWLRRVTLDLTDLPPSPEEMRLFLADPSPAAREKVVDRLLQSPRFGERMAVSWLDLARYADSYGYQSDQLSPTWPYRDWVVRAFNSGLPYDQFLTWQIAGDLLPNATRDQKLATAFNRLHRMTNEGGSVPKEWRLEGVADRVNTFGVAVLGLTTECARCHDHKFDAFTQRDYYSLTAFFNSIDEHGLYDRADIVPSPSILLPNAEQEARLRQTHADLKQREAELQSAREGAGERFAQWLASNPELRPVDETGYFDFEQWEGVNMPNKTAGGGAPGVRQDEVPLVDGRHGKAAELDGENNVHFPELGKFTRTSPFTVAFWMRDGGAAAEPAVVFQASSGTDTGPHGYDLLLEKGLLSARIFRHWPGNGIGIQTEQPVAPLQWTHVAVAYDGSSRAAGLRIYLNGKPAPTKLLRDRIYRDTYQHTLTFGQRFRDRGFKGGRIDDLHIFSRDLTQIEIAQLHSGRPVEPASASRQDLLDYYLRAIDPGVRQAAAALTAARRSVVEQENQMLEVAVMEEMPSPRETHLLSRGRYDAPVDDSTRVRRAVPAALPPLPPGAPVNRLGLARWLTRPDHPLTARVAVNRFWSLFWGSGLVETSENFGVQGSLPSHPELLDWLARDFITSGWNVRRFLKQIVLSSTYGQASGGRTDLIAQDPENRLLARGPSHRLGAEAIRDSVLFAAGLLDERPGGPPVSPYQPGDLWRESNSMSPAYKQSVGSDLYRRSLYTVWKRTAPMPNMTMFDAGSREVCQARRGRTSTPLQALVLLNDTQFVEAARVIAENAVAEQSGAAERMESIFTRLAARPPDPRESALLQELYQSQLAQFSAEPQLAAGLLQAGEKKPRPGLPPAEVAAAAMAAQAVINSDLFIWKR